MRTLFYTLYTIHYTLIAGLSAVVSEKEPVQLIVDTDLGFDVDDVGALAVANYLQDIGECEILGVIHNTGFFKGIGGVDVINNWYSRRNLEYGAYRDEWGSSDDAQNAQDAYTSSIEYDYPSDVQNYEQVYDDVKGYQAALNKARNNSVVIASVGEPTALRNILKADYDLFVSKVKEIHYMDGGYNFGCGDSDGSGWSPWLGSTEDCDGAAQYVIEHVPKSIKQVFSLNGEDIYTGSRFNEGCGDGPVKEAYQIWTDHGSRPSWDPIMVYIAVMGTDSLYSTAYAGTNYVTYYGDEDFDNSNTDNNQFQVWIDGEHNDDVAHILDSIICAAPCGSTKSIGGCSGYTLQSSKNCYGDRDGNGWHGADDLEDPADSSCGVMTLAACQSMCDNTDGCDGISVSAAGDGQVNCYRKANIDIELCDWFPKIDTYTRNRR